MNNAFLKSYEVLEKVYTERAFGTIELNRTLFTAKKSDKALITKIVYGVLDTDIETDYVLSVFTKKVNKKVKTILKLGVYCLLYLSIPPYAVVNDAAELAKITGDKRLVGFVNATLKNISARIGGEGISYPTDVKEYLSVKYSYPMWALKKLIKDYGAEIAEKIVSFKMPDYTSVRVNTARISADKFASALSERGVKFEKGIFPDSFRIFGNTENIDERYFVRQSEASMTVARAVEGYGKVLDCCAAPGGKAVYVKQLNYDAEVTACDIHIHRVKLIESYAESAGVKLKVLHRDATTYFPEWDGFFDVVLCDVPCSGFGVLGSRPDIKLFRENADIPELMKTQYSILTNCSRYVKKGGRLLYSTCTLFDDENGRTVKKFLAENKAFVPSEIHSGFAPCDGLTSYQFLPYKDKVQGFYLAEFTRTE